MDNTIPSIDVASIDMDTCYFNPGCAMNLYKPDVSVQMFHMLQAHFGDVKLHTICCQNNPGLPAGSTIINNCAGCDRRFRSEYPGIQTISIWEVLDSIQGLELPKHEGLTVSVHDSCSFRKKPQVHAAVRSLLGKMHIAITEAEFSGTSSICCGDNFYGRIPNEQVVQLQKQRAAQMPCTDVVVYCIGCVHSMTAGGKRPHYLPDLVFGKTTQPMHNTLDRYHKELRAYIGQH